nr:N-acetyltransferase [Acidobacteriota bacterium]
MNIRRANSDDAGQIAEIYNFYILNTHHTFETEPLSAEEM